MASLCCWTLMATPNMHDFIRFLGAAAAMQRWSGGGRGGGEEMKQGGGKVCTCGGVGGVEGVRGDKSGDGGTWWEQQKGLSEHTECPPLLRSQLAALLTDVPQRTDGQDRGGMWQSAGQISSSPPAAAGEDVPFIRLHFPSLENHLKCHSVDIIGKEPGGNLDDNNRWNYNV